MKTTLRLTIQFAWAYLGLLSSFVVACVLRNMIVMHRPLPFAHGDVVWRISNSCMMLLGFLILGAFIRSGWRAVFCFSEQSVILTVALVSLLMACVFIYGKHYYVQPWINSHLRGISGSVRALIELAISGIGLAGAWKFRTVMPRVLAKVLFPQVNSPAPA